MWNSDGGITKAGTAISPRHVIQAAHYHSSTNTAIYFCDNGGNVYTNRVVGMAQVGNTDIMVLSLEEELPSAIRPAMILPADYADYIVTGQGLPTLHFDYSEHAVVANLETISRNVNGCRPVMASREKFFEEIVQGDSGDPKFLVLGNQVVFLCEIQTFGKDRSGAGPSLVDYYAEIQMIMDSLCPGYGLRQFDFSMYPKLTATGGN